MKTTLVHNQVDDGKVKTTLYKVRWSGYDHSRTGDTWKPITYPQGYSNMVKTFKESKEKDFERLANVPKHTVLFMTFQNIL